MKRYPDNGRMSRRQPREERRNPPELMNEQIDTLRMERLMRRWDWMTRR